QLTSEIPMVHGDRVQLQQVFLNLILNACDAMLENEPAERKLVVAASPDGTGGAQISVTDHGSGIPEAILDKLFEPFVTTKLHGLGLGLSISRSIVSAHGGRLWAANNPERGASFFVVLPRAADQSA